MPRFKPYDYSQHSMVLISYQEQLQPGTLRGSLSD